MLRVAPWCHQSVTEGAVVDHLQDMQWVGGVSHDGSEL